MAATNNISIVISAKDDASKTLKNLGISMGEASGSSNRFADSLRSVRDVALGVVAAQATTALAGGFKSMLTYSFDATRQVQQYVAGIKGLTANSAEASGVIKGMVDYVQGKPFDRIEVLGAARNLLTFGDTAAQTQKDIELLGRAVTISGGSWDSLSQIFGRVRSSGRLMTDDFNQLMYAGVNVGSTLTKNLGVSMTQLRGRLQDGTITFDQFRKALEDALPADAVEKSSNTIDNRLMSLKASFRNLGFSILGVDFSQLDDSGQPLVKKGGLLDMMSQGMERITKALRSPAMTAGMQDLATAFQLLFTTLSGGDPTIEKGQEKFIPYVKVLLQVKDYLTDVAIGARILFDVLTGGDPTLKAGEDRFVGFVKVLDQAKDVVTKWIVPSFEALWSTLADRLLPTLGRLWQEVLVPLIPVLGVTLVGALKLALDAVNFLITAFTDIANFMLDHKQIVIDLTAAFVALAIAMNFNAAFNAMTIGFETMRLVTIPNFMATITSMRAAIGATTVMGSIGVAGALADIALVTQAIQTVHDAIRAMNDEADAIAASTRAQDAALARIQDLAKNGTPEQKARAKQVLNRGFALGTNYAPGGVTMVGERGPELVQLPRGSKVFPADQTRQMVNGGGGGISIGAVHLHNELDQRQFLGDLMWRGRLAGLVT